MATKLKNFYDFKLISEYVLPMILLQSLLRLYIHVIFYKKLGYLARESQIGRNFLAILKNIDFFSKPTTKKKVLGLTKHLSISIGERVKKKLVKIRKEVKKLQTLTSKMRFLIKKTCNITSEKIVVMGSNFDSVYGLIMFFQNWNKILRNYKNAIVVMVYRFAPLFKQRFFCIHFGPIKG